MFTQKGKLRHSKTYRRIVLSYLLIFLIPFAVLSFFIFYYVTLVDTDSQRVQNENAIQASAETLRDTYLKAREIANLLVFDDDFTRLMSDFDDTRYSQAHALQLKINPYAVLNRDFRNIWAYLPGASLLYSSTDSCENATFSCKRFFSVRTDGLLRALLNGETVLVTDAYNRQKYIMFACALPGDAPAPAIVYQMHPSAIEKAFAWLEAENGGFCMKSGAETLFTGFAGAAAAPETLSWTPLSTAGGYAVEKASAGAVYRVSFFEFDWVFYVWARPGAPLNGLLLPVFLVMLLLGIGLSAVMLFSSMLYHPIRHIRQKLPAKPAGEGTDYEYIENGIELMHIELAQLKTSLESHAQETRRFMAYSLMCGHFARVEDLGSDLDTAFPQAAPRAVYACAAMGEAGRAQILREGEHALRAAYSPNDEPCELGLVFLYGPDASPEAAREILARAYPGRAVGMSPAFDKLSLAPIALSRALTALSFAQIEGRGGVTDFAAVPGANEGLDKELKRLETLRCADAAQCAPAMRALCAYLAENESCLPPEENINLLGLHGDMDAREWMRDVKSCIQRRAARPQAPDTLPIEKMKAYIQENCFAPSFSVKQMAGAFGMSQAALSQYFKSESGTLLSDCITERKMEEARRMLEETDVSIADIGLAIGYYNAYSFTRRFQQIHGVTPSEYRQAGRA